LLVFVGEQRVQVCSFAFLGPAVAGVNEAVRRAILSDIHANLEAFQAVLKNIEKRGVDEIVCLGDVVGYGPDPRECIKLAMDFGFCLRGNHEDALLFIAADFNIEAAQSIDWTRDQLNCRDYPRQENHALWNFLGDLTDKRVEGDVLYVHGSPRVPTREYVRPVDVHDPRKMAQIFEMIEHICFCGHTHEPGIFTEAGKFYFPRLLNNVYHVSSEKCLINVGSVGQPRDRDPRACYVVFDGQKVEYVRVSYDVKRTMVKIKRAQGLADVLAMRLAKGR
jgi:predicted phosphodiesterase